MHRLRHLVAEGCSFDGHPYVGRLKHLHTLSMEVGDWIEEESLMGLSELRNFSVNGPFVQPYGWVLASPINKMVSLEKLPLTKFGGEADSVLLPPFMPFSHHIRLQGMNVRVGIPHKEAAVGVCDEVHPLAKSIGAVNTIVRRASDGKLIGYNTDCEAAITAMEDAFRVRKGASGEASNTSPLARKLFVLVGAGGAGRALAFGAKSRGARIVIFNRNYERAKALAQAVGGEARPFEEKDSFCPEKGMILANASAVGMQPRTDQTPVAKEALGAYDLVFDSVYTPRNTRLLTHAEEVGAIAVSGVKMFIRQAIGQFNLFTGGEAPEEFMRNIVLTKF
ncbi:hypothetical protein ACLOJK_003497 [Asimina triloba]